MTTTAASLKQKMIWLTRPLTQSEYLQQALQLAGANTFCLPLLEIVPVEPKGATLTRLLNLDQYDLVFFVSSNAAKAGMEAINNWWPQFPAHIVTLTVGPGTAKVLADYGLLAYFPKERMDSEGMLALPQLQDIKGKKALIVRGVGGREILSAGLKASGVSVDYAELYERRLPEYEQAYLQECLTTKVPEVIVISSSEAMDNLKTLFVSWYKQWQQLPLHVVSTRLAVHAEDIGFQNVVCMAGATDEAIINGLHQLYSGQGS